jgi:hypothetical protein
LYAAQSWIWVRALFMVESSAMSSRMFTSVDCACQSKHGREVQCSHAKFGSDVVEVFDRAGDRAHDSAHRPNNSQDRNRIHLKRGLGVLFEQKRSHR